MQLQERGGGTGPNVSMFYLRKQEKWSQEIHQLPGLLKKQPNLENKIYNIEIRVVQNTACQVMTTRNEIENFQTILYPTNAPVNQW